MGHECSPSYSNAARYRDLDTLDTHARSYTLNNATRQGRERDGDIPKPQGGGTASASASASTAAIKAWFVLFEFRDGFIVCAFESLADASASVSPRLLPRLLFQRRLAFLFHVIRITPLQEIGLLLLFLSKDSVTFSLQLVIFGFSLKLRESDFSLEEDNGFGGKRGGAMLNAN